MDLRKNEIRAAFSRAANTYDAYADIQRQAAGLLLERAAGLAPARILEIGCATGGYTAALAAGFPEAQIVALDFSPPMVALARTKIEGRPQVRFVCVDAEDFLRESAERFDLITSNATLQWLTALEAALERIAGHLRPEGEFVASLFGPRTFEELGHALAAVRPGRERLLATSFAGLEQINSWCRTAFATVELEELFLVRYYPSVRELFQQMRRTGTTGGMGRSRPILGSKTIRALEEWLAWKYGGCQMTSQLILIKARK